MTRARDTAGIIQYNKITVDSNNAVGIGSSIPDCKLDINGGLRVVGVSTFESDIQIGDSIELNIGNSNDLKIYHDGSNSYVEDAGTGALILKGSFIRLHSNTGENMLTGAANGAVQLMYDNNTKLQTTGIGITVTGAIHADGLSLGDDERINVGIGSDLQIYHDGSNSLIHNDVGAIIIENDASNSNPIYIKAKAGEHSIIANHNGGVELYYDNSKKLETVTGGVTITGTASATTFSGSGSNLTSLNASQLSSGTIPDARFPSTLPAVDGSQLTGIVGGTSFDWRDGSLF